MRIQTNKDFSNCRNLISDFQKTHPNNNINIMLNSLNSKNIFELANAIDQHIKYTSQNNSFCISRNKLAKLALTFHEKAGTLTPNVEKNIKKIEENCPILLLPHQPNLFPSLAVVTPFILLEKVSYVLLKKTIPTAAIYLIIDYDFGNDNRFRTSRFPDRFRRNGLLYLNNGISKSKSKSLMWLLTKPSKRVVDKWINDLVNVINRTLKYISKSNLLTKLEFNQYYQFVVSNLDLIKRMIFDSYLTSQSLTEFNSFFLSKLINVYWNMEICFIPGHLIHLNNDMRYKLLIKKSNEIVEHTNTASSILNNYGIKTNMFYNKEDTLFWYFCNKCHQRLNIKRGGKKNINIKHLCHATQKEEKLSVSMEQLSSLSNVIYPKVIVDNLLDTITFGKVGGVGYIGQAEHLLISNFVGKQIGIPTPPQIILNSIGLHYGLIELSILFDQDSYKKSKPTLVAFHNIYYGKASILYYIISMGIYKIKEIWDIFFSNTENVHNPNELAISYSPFPQLVNEKIVSLLNDLVK